MSRRLTPEQRAAQKAWWQDVPWGHDPHHAILAQRIRARFPELEWDLRNRVIVPRRVHELHHSANGPRIPRSMLPDSVWQFALELDGGDPDGYFTNQLLETYPDDGLVAA
ncbi:MAG: hypothetical protein PHS14_16370 [Elusimicrobia bacterium]|nr:hypothetical protein [Elusimicrobiota bacterium]